MRLTFAALLLAAAAAHAEPTRAAVEAAIGAYEPLRTGEEIRRLGPGTDRVLVRLATDAGASRLYRARALHALGFVPSPEGRDLLRAVIAEKRHATEGLDPLDVGACARALGHFGPELAPDLLSLLTHPVPEVRQSAALGLGETGAPQARAALSQRLLAERDPSVLKAIQRGLQRLDRR